MSPTLCDSTGNSRASARLRLVLAADMPPPRHTSTPAELVERLELERAGVPFLSWRDAQGAQQLLALVGDHQRLTVGRREDNDIPLDWDGQVSRVHVIIERAGPDWMVVDAGLSQNGTWIGGTRISGARRLSDGDVLRVGQTLISFTRARGVELGPTSIGRDLTMLIELTAMQRRVLDSLCRPFANGAPFAAPATNQVIADELQLSIQAVKTHLRTLFAKFAISDLPQNQKRLQLAERALGAGLVAASEAPR